MIKNERSYSQSLAKKLTLHFKRGLKLLLNLVLFGPWFGPLVLCLVPAVKFQYSILITLRIHYLKHQFYFQLYYHSIFLRNCKRLQLDININIDRCIFSQINTQVYLSSFLATFIFCIYIFITLNQSDKYIKFLWIQIQFIYKF